MKSRPPETVNPGDTLYLFGQKIHYLGVLQSGEETVHVYWSWNKYRRRRSYKALPHWEFEIEREYMRKTKKKN